MRRGSEWVVELVAIHTFWRLRIFIWAHLEIMVAL